MPRDLPIGNGRLLIAFNKDYHIADLYFPQVGKESHAEGHPFRFGVWVEGTFSWTGPEWRLSMQYLPDTLVTDVEAHNERLALKLSCQDFVDFHSDIYVKKIVVHNLADREREVRLFFHHDFHISGNDVGDTAFYEPKSRSLIHYKDHRYFLMNGLCYSLRR